MSPSDDDWDWIRKIIQDQERLMGPFLKMLEEHQRLVGPSLKIIEEQQRLLGPSLKAIEDQQRLVGPSLETLRWLDVDMRPFLQTQERIATDFKTHISAQQRDVAAASDAFKQWQRLSETYLAGLPFESVQVDKSGGVTIGLDTASAEKVQAQLAELAEEVASATTPVEYVERLSAFLRRLPPSVARTLFFILTNVVLSFIVSIAANINTPLVETWWRDFVGRAPQEVRELLPQAARQAYDPRQLEPYRFVAVKRLTVRNGAGTSHTKVAVLPLGKTVRVLATNRSWVQVQIRNAVMDA